MSGGPIDLTPFGSVVTGIGILYGVLAIGALLIALKLPKTKSGKAWATLVVFVVFGAVPASSIWRGYQTRSSLNEAMGLFQERCKTAGEKITRTVDNIEGVVWMKWRLAGVSREQFALDDPYGKDCSLEGCILQLLSGGEVPDARQRDKKSIRGYRFVETVDPRDGVRYRYRGVFRSVAEVPKEEFSRHVESTGFGAEPDGRYLALERESVDRFTSRYGIVWEDISTRGDRERWIAGGSLKVIDLQSSEPVAERIGYLIDTGQGSTSGFRDPWGWAKSYAPQCPRRDEHTWDFAVRVLQPARQGD